VDPEALTLADRNPRRGDVQELVQSFRVNGFYGTVVVDRTTGWVVAGNHRVKAARELRMPEIPVSYIRTDGVEHAQRLLLADNRLSDIATYDTETLAALLTELAATEQGLAGTGYTTTDHQALLDELGDAAFQEGLTDPDEVPEPPEEPISRDGDLWQIGPHRVGCGSSLDLAHVRRVTESLAIRLVWTDPPYNVNYEGKTKDRLKIANDAMTPAEFRAFIGEAMRVTFEVSQPGACIYVAYAELESMSFRQAFDEAGWKYSQTLVWVKNAAVMGRQDYNWRHEPLLYGWRPGAGHYFNQDFTQTTVIDETPNYRKMSKDELVALLEGQRDAMATTVVYEDKPNRNALHPTMKPVSLCQRMVVASSRTGDVVYDPFGGSGSTAIAAHKANRVAVLNELDPRYVDVIVERLSAFAGQPAVRHDGALYTELKQQKGRAA